MNRRQRRISPVSEPKRFYSQFSCMVPGEEETGYPEVGQRGLQRLTREQLIQASSHSVNRNSAPISGNVLHEADSSGAIDWPRLTSLPNISNGLFVAGIPMTSPNLPWKQGLLEAKSSLGVRRGKPRGACTCLRTPTCRLPA